MNNLSNPVPGYIYLVWAIGTPRYKIGKSKNPSRRIEQLNQQSCYPLKLLDFCYFDDCDRHEKRVHRLLNRWRIHGEWFEIPSNLLSYTEIWMYDPKCFDLKGINQDVIIVCKNKQKPLKISLVELQSSLLNDLPSSWNIPGTEADLSRLVELLGTFSKLPEINRGRIGLEIENLLGASPCSSQESTHWKKILKKIKNERDNYVKDSAK